MMITKRFMRFLACFITISFIGCSAPSERVRVDPSLSPGFGNYEIISLTEILPEAERISKEWSDDALLMLVGIDIYSELVSEESNIYFHYESPSIDDEYLDMTCSNTGCESVLEIAHLKMLDYGSIPVDLQKLEIDTLEATIITQNNTDGTFFIENTFGNLQLYSDEKGTLLWRVYYQQVSGGEAFQDVNATTGEIIDSRN